MAPIQSDINNLHIIITMTLPLLIPMVSTLAMWGIARLLGRHQIWCLMGLVSGIACTALSVWMYLETDGLGFPRSYELPSEWVVTLFFVAWAFVTWVIAVAVALAIMSMAKRDRTAGQPR